MQDNLSASLMPVSIVLHVDDSANDILFLGYAFAEAGIGAYYCAVSSGREALDYLEGKGEFADRQRFPLPCLVLLDIQMPSMDGFDLLARIRAHPQFHDLPVCMYSSSDEEVDIRRALRLGVDSYIQKPLRWADQLEFARHIAATWFSPRSQESRYPRILLRKSFSPRHGAQAGLYLQPDGSWNGNRESARQFAHAGGNRSLPAVALLCS